MRRIFNTQNLMRFILLSFVASVVYLTVRVIIAPAVAPPSDVPINIKGDYALMLLESALGVAAMLLPRFLSRRVRLDIPKGMITAYAIFLYCAIFLGEVRNFYYTVPHWDTILHTFSGVATGALGFSIVSLLNKSDDIAFSLSPFFVALFAFCFALSLGVIWEFYEFTIDSLFDLNMQKYALETGEPLFGQAALMDTMKDLIVDALGALLMAIVGYISLKYKKGWLEQFIVRRKGADKHNEP